MLIHQGLTFDANWGTVKDTILYDSIASGN